MSPTAILLNSVALLAIIYYPEKPKPYLYLIANLIITDLLVAVIGTSIILVCKNLFLFTNRSMLKSMSMYK